MRELFLRTTQFNTTGRKFSIAELSALPPGGARAIFTLEVSDRFADHGLVGAAVIERGEIVALAVSCRVMGLGVEHRFLEAILIELAASHDVIVARIVDTSRNLPVRNLYRDHGFHQRPDGCWTRSLGAPQTGSAAAA